MDEFKQQAEHADTHALDLVRRFVTTSTAVHVEPGALYDLRTRIVDEFRIRHQEVYVVGSAQLGFSIAPRKRWKRFDDESDIDVALVSQDLYKKMWLEVAELQQRDPHFDWAHRGGWRKNHGRGWLRPDMLPPSNALPRRASWFEFFTGLTREEICGPYKINAGLYYDLDFLELYQTEATQGCINELRDRTK